MVDKEEGCIGCIGVLLVLGVLKWAYDKLSPWVSTHVNETIGIGIGFVVASIAIWQACRAWSIHCRSESKRKLFDLKFSPILAKYEKDFPMVESNLEQTRKVADFADVAIAEMERHLRTLS